MKLKVPVELLRKYSQPGPRYTSYPTVPHFQTTFDGKAFQREIEASQNPHISLSLYFHLPFCKTLCYYCGCNMIITHRSSKIEHYLGLLEQEIQILAPLLDRRRKVVQIHWGGGSPDYLSPEQMTRLFELIQAHFSLDPQAEISIELDPRRLQENHLSTLRSLGFNRVSFGVQDFDPKVQQAVNRIQPERITKEAVEQARSLGFDSINLDLIYGLPYQTAKSYEKTLEKILELKPDRLAVFHYAHVPWLKKHQRLIPEEALPSLEEKLRMFQLVVETLTEAGYVYIGLDHFALPEDPLVKAFFDKSLHRNFQGYTTHREAEVYAFGITGISQLKTCYAQNEKKISLYQKALREGRPATFCGIRLSQDDQIRRYVITELMCNLKVDFQEVEKRFSIDFPTYFQKSLERLRPMEQEGLLRIGEKKLEVSPLGRFVIRNIAMAFDRYLEQDKKVRYSKTL